jgi:hypothetical protein
MVFLQTSRLAVRYLSFETLPPMIIAITEDQDGMHVGNQSNTIYRGSVRPPAIGGRVCSKPGRTQTNGTNKVDLRDL